MTKRTGIPDHQECRRMEGPQKEYGYPTKKTTSKAVGIFFGQEF